MRFLITIILLFLFQNLMAQEKTNSFEGYVGREGYYTQNSEAEKFFDFMVNNNGKIVYLMLYLDDVQDVDFVEGQRSKDGRIIFSAIFKDLEGYNSGAEYLIHFTNTNIKYFEYNTEAKRLDGYFKIWDINGPRQGLFSINLRPVKAN